MKNYLIRFLKVSLRVTIIFSIILLIILIGDVFSNAKILHEKLINYHDIIQSAMILCIVLGLGIATKWELTGAIITTLAYIVLAVIHPEIFGLVVFLASPLFALLLIIDWRLKKLKL